ncbi:hypothetical protein QJQ45_023485 [Haematococcus lacustris]|nr:hypothetical protein QJQ45_023485 [Haematococcus lacustris]
MKGEPNVPPCDACLLVPPPKFLYNGLWMESDEWAPSEDELYEVDDSIEPLEAVLLYSQSSLPAQRHAYIRGMGAAVQHAAAPEAALQQLISAGRGQLQPAHGPEAADSLLARVLQRPTSSLLLLQQLEQLAHMAAALGRRPCPPPPAQLATTSAPTPTPPPLAVQHLAPTAPRAVADLGVTSPTAPGVAQDAEALPSADLSPQPDPTAAAHAGATAALASTLGGQQHPDPDQRPEPAAASEQPAWAPACLGPCLHSAAQLCATLHRLLALPPNAPLHVSTSSQSAHLLSPEPGEEGDGEGVSSGDLCAAAAAAHGALLSGLNPGLALKLLLLHVGQILGCQGIEQAAELGQGQEGRRGGRTQGLGLCQDPGQWEWEGQGSSLPSGSAAAEAPAAAMTPLLAPLPSCLSAHLHSPFAQGLSSSHCLAALQLLAAARDLLKCDHCQLECDPPGSSALPSSWEVMTGVVLPLLKLGLQTGQQAGSLQEVLQLSLPLLACLPACTRPQPLLSLAQHLGSSPVWSERALLAQHVPALMELLTPPGGWRECDPAAAEGVVAARLDAGSGLGSSGLQGDGEGTAAASREGQGKGRVPTDEEGMAAKVVGAGQGSGSGVVCSACGQSVATLEQAAREVLQVMVQRLGGQSQWAQAAVLKAMGPTLQRLPRPLVLEEPASLALFCTGLAPDLGPAPEVMPACCAAFTGVALKAGRAAWMSPSCPLLPAFRRAWDPAGHTTALSSLISGLPDLAAMLGPQAAAEQLLPPVLALLPHRLPDLGPALVPVLAPLLALLPAEAHLDLVCLLPALVTGSSLQGSGQQVEGTTGTAAGATHGTKCGAWRVRLALAQQLHPLLLNLYLAAIRPTDHPTAAPGQDPHACCHATGPALTSTAAPAAATITTLPGLPAAVENMCAVSFLGQASGMGILPDQEKCDEAEEQACRQAQASQRWPGLLALLEVTHCLTLDPVAAVRQEAGWQLGCMLHSTSCMAHPHQHLSPCPAPSRARCPADGCGGQCLLLDVQQASWAHVARQELTEDQPELLAAAHGIAGQGPGGKDPNGLCEQLLAMVLGPLPPPPPPGRSLGSQTPSRDEAVLPGQSARLQHTALNSHALLTLLAVCQGYATSACLVLPGRCEGYRVQVLGTAPGQAAAAHPSRRPCHQAGARGQQQWQAVSPQCEGAAQVAAAGCELQQHLAQGDIALAQASAARAARALATAMTPAL